MSWIKEAGSNLSRIAASDAPLILMMLSGGLDSVGALYELLTSEEYASYDVMIHHVINHTPDERARAEIKAVERVLANIEYLAARGEMRTPVYVGTSEFDMTNQFGFQIEWQKWVFISSQICYGEKESPFVKRIQKIAIGMNAEDPAWNSGGWEQAQRILDTLLEERQNKVEIICPVIKKTKEEIIEILPLDIACCTWSCRSPLYHKGEANRCGECHACEQTKKWEVNMMHHREHMKRMGRYSL